MYLQDHWSWNVYACVLKESALNWSAHFGFCRESAALICLYQEPQQLQKIEGASECQNWLTVQCTSSLQVLLIINHFFVTRVALLPIFSLIVRAIIVAQCLLLTTPILHPILKAIHNDMHMQMTNEKILLVMKLKWK